MKVKLIGIDLAKNVFQLCALNQNGRVLFNRAVRRNQLVSELDNIRPATIAMGDHYMDTPSKKKAQAIHRRSPRVLGFVRCFSGNWPTE